MKHHPPAAEPPAGPSGSGTVVLELGPGAGALVLYTPAEQDGTEIEVSRSGGRRTHSMVRPRRVAGTTIHAAVYPDLAPGDYTIWAGSRAVASASVAAGGVTTAKWPGS
jgi:hypothetical protein